MIKFDGFESPEQNWSKLPHQLINALPLIETVGEMKVILYILRHTWGYKDDEKKITLDEFENGRKRKDGSRIDSGTGLSVPTIRDGLKRASEHGFIVIETDSSDLARVKNFYSLNIQGERNLHPDYKNLSPGLQESFTRTEKETKERKLEKELSPTNLPDEENPKIVTEPKETTQQLMFGILCKVMKRDQKLEPGRTAAFAKKLIDAGYTHQQIDLWYSPGNNYYWCEYYKGAKNRTHPDESDISKTLVPSKEYQENPPENIELTPEIEELESHFENRTGFYVPVSYAERQELWIKPCNVILTRSEGLEAAIKLMDRAMEKARESNCSYKAPSSLLTFALNHAENNNGNGSAHAIDDEIGGCYV